MKEMSYEEIRQKLTKHYDHRNPPCQRELNVLEMHNGAMMALDGTPQKGYAIYIEERSRINLYDNEGKRFRIIDDVEVVNNHEAKVK